MYRLFMFYFTYKSIFLTTKMLKYTRMNCCDLLSESYLWYIDLKKITEEKKLFYYFFAK